jgi:hypothetical protein
MILDAVTRGVNNIDKIASITILRRDEVELILNGLSIQHLIFKNWMKGIFWQKESGNQDHGNRDQTS